LVLAGDSNQSKLRHGSHPDPAAHRNPEIPARPAQIPTLHRRSGEHLPDSGDGRDRGRLVVAAPALRRQGRGSGRPGKRGGNARAAGRRAARRAHHRFSRRRPRILLA
jgi:hypothetical protein